ncbi:ribosome biogenesis GTPase Der [Candidatus Profftia sp. (ex Adelges kitamiensis)]|uniref:ribosome biogenesis GTPase Der n=1 Tax=Candidatus Profftia sp. (ex Adelges kitamiensis) TaxID=2864218 RepID=UPI001CE2BB48|nr:ribosome biogenesis GTPase Der [Candidatus Profftia sp. (ex Adelges kitamiensis)]
MIPVVALVGHTNVGKSTLFNCLTRTHDALIADFPGLTRDRRYGRAMFNGYQFIIIDTGGVDSIIHSGIELCIANQSFTAIQEADIILFIVDARVGLLPIDKSIAKNIRNFNKVTFVVVNKIDGMACEIAVSSFYELGFKELYPITASHGRGITYLIKKIFIPFAGTLKDKYQPIKEEVHAAYCVHKVSNIVEKIVQKKRCNDFLNEQPIKLVLVGRPNVGKSTLINCILGEERVVVYDIGGTTRDSIYIPIRRGNRAYILIDTAGVRQRNKVINTVEKFSVIKTLQAIEDSNVVLLILDAYEGIIDQDLSLLSFILNNGRSLVIVVNKWDSVSKNTKIQVKKILNLKLGFVDFARIHFISARYKQGISNLFNSIKEAYDCATNRISTSLLTRIMHMAQENHQPILIRGRRVKLKYAHSGGYNPPIIVIHGNQVEDLTSSYKRYLINYFRRSMNVMGTPIRIQFKESDNPYLDKQNILNQNQIRKRKRMLAYIKQ